MKNYNREELYKKLNLDNNEKRFSEKLLEKIGENKLLRKYKKNEKVIEKLLEIIKYLDKNYACNEKTIQEIITIIEKIEKESNKNNKIFDIPIYEYIFGKIPEIATFIKDSSDKNLENKIIELIKLFENIHYKKKIEKTTKYIEENHNQILNSDQVENWLQERFSKFRKLSIEHMISKLESLKKLADQIQNSCNIEKSCNIDEIINVAELIAKQLGIDSIDEAIKIIEKAVAGKEIKKELNLERWFQDRFKPNLVFIDEKGYAEMCIDALKILGSTAATDYGASRQRDLGHLWADMTRGYLGELAFKEYLLKKWDVEVKLGHESGLLENFLHADIHEVKNKEGYFFKPNLKISIKTTKWNGIWLDIPGDQFNHSDIHVLVKVGVGRDHLFSFFKQISVFKDKVLRYGINSGIITENESNDIFDKIPSFRKIPAYICGFIKKESFVNEEKRKYSDGIIKGKKKYVITEWCGKFDLDQLKNIKEENNLETVEFAQIGKFAHDSGYLFNTGSLCWQESDWKEVVEKLKSEK
jgi:hypothetical protein